MNAVNWDSVPVADPPPGAVEVPLSGFGFLAVAGILELGVPDAVYCLPREARPGGVPDSGTVPEDISVFLADAGIRGPADPLAHCWFIVPPPSMPTEGFWEALDEAEPLRQAGAGPLGRLEGLRAALQVLYSNS
ncbi:hypothetical protein ACIPVK_13730 [Paeniglutamicibacter sp. MACA_103]|uniref:hypothetical protein n=1 Tax=Paeniglutamicibacter sp. MACA_103 TaxID=3377337 RepID=UPI0038933495